MTATVTREPLIGASILRREDRRFIAGRGTFTDDITLAGTLYCAFVRSPYACARIRAIDVEAARRAPGVHAVYTGRDLAAGGVNPLPPGWLIPDMRIAEHRALAVDTVRHMGEAVAVVVADSVYRAKDAAELVSIEYDELPCVVDATIAKAAGSPQVHANAPTTFAFTGRSGTRTPRMQRCAAHTPSSASGSSISD